MQSNEELAKRSKDGDRKATLKLWTKLERFIDIKSSQYMRYVYDAAIDRDDLKQSAYIAMLRAVEYYDPNSEYKFLTYFSKTLLKEFNITAGLSRKRHSVVSINTEIFNGEGDDNAELLELLEDENAQLPLCEVLAYDWQLAALRTILEAMTVLSEKDERFIWGMYFEGLTQEKAGAIAGYSCRQASSLAHERIMQRLRHCSKTGALRELLNCCDTYGDSGSLAFHVPASVAALQNIRNQKRREKLWQKRI